MRRCVIFDMDGVIIDSEPLHHKCEREMFSSFGIEVSNDEHSAFMGTTDESMWTQVNEQHGLPMSVADAMQMKKKLYLTQLKNEPNLRPIQYIPELIAELSKNGFLLALASSSPIEQIEYILNEFELEPYFQSIVSGEDVERGKPSPDIFLEVAQQLGISPEQCIVIEDSNNGVRAAKDAGMMCVGFKNPNSGNQNLSQADMLIDSIGELTPQIIDSLF